MGVAGGMTCKTPPMCTRQATKTQTTSAGTKHVATAFKAYELESHRMGITGVPGESCWWISCEHSLGSGHSYSQRKSGTHPWTAQKLHTASVHCASAGSLVSHDLRAYKQAYQAACGCVRCMSFLRRHTPKRKHAAKGGLALVCTYSQQPTTKRHCKGTVQHHQYTLYLAVDVPSIACLKSAQHFGPNLRKCRC